MTGSYKLKWLNGLLAGRELVLPAGEIRLGGNDPDIALTLDNGGEAVLVVEETGVGLLSQACVWVDGKRWDGDGGHLPLHVPIDMAGQAFLLGAADDTLVSVRIPPRRSGPKLTKLTGLKQRVTPGMLACAAAAVAVLGCIAAFFASPPAGDAAPSKTGGLLIERLKGRTPPGLKIAEDRSGVMVLSGYCADSAEVDRFRQQVKSEGVLLNDDTLCANTLRRSVGDVLRLNGYQEFDVGDGETPGVVVIRGSFADDARWRSTTEQLRSLRGLRYWSIVNDGADSFERLLSMLSERDLLNGISISMEQRTLVVRGALPAERMQRVEQVLADYNKPQSGGLQAQFEAIAASPASADLLPAPIASIGGKADGFFVELENGMRLQRGAVLPNGFVVYALSQSFMALRKGETLTAVPLNL
jgi:type III secretion protein D